MNCQFEQGTRAFYTWHVHNNPYTHFRRKQIEPILCHEGMSQKFPFTIAVVVTSRSSSFKYTTSVHEVHAGAERNVCNIAVSTETPQTTTNPSQTLLMVYKLAHLPLPHSKSSPPRHRNLKFSLFTQIRYKCKNKVSSTNQYILEVYIIYLYTCIYVSVHERFCHSSHVPRLRLACTFLKFHQNIHVLTPYIHVDK